MRVLPAGAFDHIQTTISVQDLEVTNYLEAGIGVFGDRPSLPDPFAPRFWAFKTQGGPKAGKFIDLGPARIGPQYEHVIRLMEDPPGSGSWIVRINQNPPDERTRIYLKDIVDLLVFNENHNETNTQCDPLHATYVSASQPLQPFWFDEQFEGCAWNRSGAGAYSWEIYWDTETQLYCPQPPLEFSSLTMLAGAPKKVPHVPPE